MRTALLLLLLVGCTKGAAPLKVPAVAAAPHLDGKLEEDAWRQCARTGAFLVPGGDAAARPHSDGRFLWDPQALYVALYAADMDIRATAPSADQDAFTLSLEDGRHLILAANGSVAETWKSGVRAAVDADGTLNDPSGETDEEWVVEAALPWSALGLAPAPGQRLRVKLARCDTVPDAGRWCGEWSGTLELGSP